MLEKRSLPSQKMSIDLTAIKSSPKFIRISYLPSAKFLSYFDFIQIKWANFSEIHVCSLIDNIKDTIILKEVIDSGVCIKFRRWLMKAFMITERHPYTKLVFKSMTEIRREEVKHMLNYKVMIHPFSTFCLYYEFVMAIMTIFYLGYVIPTDILYLTYYKSTKWLKFVLDMLMTLSICTNFYIGYMDKEKFCVLMAQKTVAVHYLKTFFVWDVLSCIPSYLIYIYTFETRYTYWQIMNWFSLFRIARVITVNHSLDMFRQYWGVPIEIYVASEIILRTCLVVLCCMTFMAFLRHYPYYFNYLPERLDIEIAREVMFTTVKSIIGVGKLKVAFTTLDAFTNIGISIVSLVLEFWILAKLFILWQRFLVISEVGEDHYQQLTGYLKYKGLPPHIREDIYCYYEFRFQTKFYEELTILEMLTDNLKKEIPKYRLDHLVEKIRFVRALPNPVIMMVVSNMESLYFCPGDVVFRVNGASNNLYFIKTGTVALHDENGIEVCHLEDGSYYGDIAVVINQTHSITMTAVTPCKIFLLRQKVLMQILDTEPDIKERVLEVSRRVLMNRKTDWVSNTYKRTRNVTVMENERMNSSKPTRVTRTLSYV